MTVALLGPNGIDSVLLANPNNKSKTIDSGDLALDSFVKSRIGSAGVLGFRNKIVDGRFDFWYEYNGTGSTGSGFGSDTMWHNDHSGTTKVHSKQLLSIGVDLPSIEVPTAKYFSRTVVTSVAGVNNFCRKYHCVESVRTLAGKSATLSFYAKANTVRNIGVEVEQLFGSGGSSSVTGIGAQLISIGTSWKRYSVQIEIPSISGKTIGTGGDDKLLVSFWFDGGSTVAAQYGLSTLGQQSGTFDLACVQLEEGTVSTPFEELFRDIAELLLNRQFCLTSMDGGYLTGSTGFTSRDVWLKVNMRATPVVIFGTNYSLGVWTNPNTIVINDSNSMTTVVTAQPSIHLIKFVRTEASMDGQGIRCVFIADARL